jgi:sulfur-oxidizing protein SoxX
MKNATETMMSSLYRYLAAGVFVLAAAAMLAKAEAAELDGKALAFDRGKGNCLTCHAMKGGDSPGTIGPELSGMKGRYDRKELIAIIGDETTRNPQTMMPPFGRNLILTNKEIEAIADFLLTL